MSCDGPARNEIRLHGLNPEMRACRGCTRERH